MESRRFGRFRLELPAHELFCDDARVALQGRTAELLALLLERAPALVPRDEIFRRLWPAGFVEDGNVFQHVYALRRALAPDPRVRVETERGRGYRLVVPVAEPARAEEPVPSLRSRARFAGGLAAAAALVVLVAVARTVPADTAARPAVLPDRAATAYRLGLYAFQRHTPDGFRKAQRYFRETVRVAPHAPDGYAGLGLIAVVRASVGDPHAAALYADAERDAAQALARGESATAHAVRGFLALRRDADGARAVAQLQEAVRIDPADATAREWYGVALLFSGRLADATAALREAVRLDPSASVNFYWLGVAQSYAGRFDEARWTLEQSRTLDGRPYERLLALVYEEAIAEMQGDVAGARALVERAGREGADRCFVVTAQLRLRLLSRTSRPGGVPRCDASRFDALAAATAFVGLGRPADALRAVRTAQHVDPWGTRFALLYDPRLGPLRRDPRLRALLI